MLKELKKSLKLNKDINSNKELLKELKSNIYNLSAIRLSDKSDGGAINTDDTMINKLSKIMELEDLIASLIDTQTRLSEEVNEMFDDPVERSLIRYRYILGYTWEHVANELGYSLRQTHRIHQKIVEKLKGL